MSTQPLVITLSPAQQSNADSVLLEQEAWDPYVNYLTRAGVVGYLNKLLFDAPETLPVCIGVDGSYGKYLYAYPSRPDLHYLMGVAHGDLGDREIALPQYTEALQCDLKESLTPKYPVISIDRYDWVGDTYDRDGNVVPHPAVTIKGKTLALTSTVYGTLLATYTTAQHRYYVRVSARKDAVENKLTAFAYAVWSGGNASMEITAPDGAEAGTCNLDLANGGNITFAPFVPTHVPGQDEEHIVNYCTNQEKPQAKY